MGDATLATVSSVSSVGNRGGSVLGGAVGSYSAPRGVDGQYEDAVALGRGTQWVDGVDTAAPVDPEGNARDASVSGPVLAALAPH